MAEFSGRLREITRAVVTQTESPYPQVVAAGVIDMISPGDYRAALEVCLPDWVKAEMTRGTRSKPPSVPTDPSKRKTAADWTRNWYANKLAGSIAIGETRKFLRDCTANDLHMAAAERYRKAAETHAEGDRWVKVALFMEEQHRGTVADITPAELKDLMEEDPS